MVNKKTGQRELCYIVKIDNIEPIVGSDNCEAAVVGGWKVMVRKGTFKPNDLAIYFEIDSLVPATETFSFLEKKHYKVKTQKYTFGGKNPGFYSQGLLMTAEDFGGSTYQDGDGQFYIHFGVDSYLKKNIDFGVGEFLTEELGVKHVDYSLQEKKAARDKGEKYKRMAARHPKLFRNPIIKAIYKTDFGKKFLYLFLGKKINKEANAKQWPVGVFPGVSKTDQERAENMPEVLNDKTPFIVTQKCDGSSGTYILSKKGKKYEFYVCSRNVRMLNEDQECFYGTHNYYWEVAKKYDIENKMKKYLESNPDLTFVCWQGEICAPDIQKNPHKLTETHFYCFHWTDDKGRKDIRDARDLWVTYNMEVVPIVDIITLPDDFEEFKLSADGYYDASVCEGHNDCAREGFVYYKIDDPTFSFKNVSRSYLLKH